MKKYKKDDVDKAWVAGSKAFLLAQEGKQQVNPYSRDDLELNEAWLEGYMDAWREAMRTKS